MHALEKIGRKEPQMSGYPGPPTPTQAKAELKAKLNAEDGVRSWVRLFDA